MIVVNVQSNLYGYSRASLIISSLQSFLTVASLSAILTEKQLKVIYQKLLNIYLLTKTSARFGYLGRQFRLWTSNWPGIEGTERVFQREWKEKLTIRKSKGLMKQNDNQNN